MPFSGRAVIQQGMVQAMIQRREEVLHCIFIYLSICLCIYLSMCLSIYVFIYLSISTSIRYLYLYLTYIYIHAGLFWSKTKKLKVQTFWRGKAIESAFIIQFVLSHADIISILCKASFANEAFSMQLELF